MYKTNIIFAAIIAASTTVYSAIVPVAVLRVRSVSALTEDIGSAAILIEQPMYGLIAAASLPNMIKSHVGAFAMNKPAAIAVYADETMFTDESRDLSDLNFLYVAVIPMNLPENEYANALNGVKTNGVLALQRDTLKYASFADGYAFFSDDTNALIAASSADSGNILSCDFKSSSMSVEIPGRIIRAYTNLIQKNKKEGLNDNLADGTASSTDFFDSVDKHYSMLIEAFEEVSSCRLGVGYDSVTGLTFEVSVSYNQDGKVAVSLSKCAPASADIFGCIPPDALAFSVCDGALRNAVNNGKFNSNNIGLLATSLEMIGSPDNEENRKFVSRNQKLLSDVGARLDEFAGNELCSYILKDSSGRFAMASQLKLLGTEADARSACGQICDAAREVIFYMTNTVDSSDAVAEFKNLTNYVSRASSDSIKINVGQIIKSVASLAKENDTDKTVSDASTDKHVISDVIKKLFGDEIFISRSFADGFMRVDAAAEIPATAYSTTGSTSASERMWRILPEYKDEKIIEAMYIPLDRFAKDIGISILDCIETDDVKASGMKSEIRILLETLPESHDGIASAGWQKDGVVKVVTRIPDSQIVAIMKILAVANAPEDEVPMQEMNPDPDDTAKSDSETIFINLNSK